MWPVGVMCGVLEVSRSGYYAWRNRPQSERWQRRRELVAEMREIHADKDMRNYGSPRMHQELVARGRQVCENTVARLMQDHDLRSTTAQKFRATTDSKHSHPVAQNHLNQEFEQSGPNRAWVSDITYIPTREGWLYLVCVLDLYSRKVVGWSMSSRMTKELVLSALEMAVKRRCPDGEQSLLHHSDRGSQYCSAAFQAALLRSGIRCSMSRKGNCYDNAVMESFFATLKKELVHQSDYATRQEARQSLFEYVEVFYNRRRRHSALGYVSPDQYEQAV